MVSPHGAQPHLFFVTADPCTWAVYLVLATKGAEWCFANAKGEIIESLLNLILSLVIQNFSLLVCNYLNLPIKIPLYVEGKNQN